MRTIANWHEASDGCGMTQTEREEGYFKEGNYVRTIANWHEASDGRGMMQTKREERYFKEGNYVRTTANWHEASDGRGMTQMEREEGYFKEEIISEQLPTGMKLRIHFMHATSHSMLFAHRIQTDD